MSARQEIDDILADCMIKADVTINRSIEDVWQFLTQPENWQRWWGGGMSDVKPGWFPHSVIRWTNGDTSQLGDCIFRRLLRVQSSGMDDVLALASLSPSQTMVGWGVTPPEGSVSFSDGGMAQKSRISEGLAALKSCVEAAKTGDYLPFYFRNRLEAHSPEELVTLCEQYPDDAMFHLAGGHFEPWLTYIGRSDLALVAHVGSRKVTTWEEPLAKFLSYLQNELTMSERKDQF